MSIEKGKVFQWEISNEEENKDGSNENIVGIDADVEGKQLSKQGVKDIGCTSNCLFMTTGKS